MRAVIADDELHLASHLQDRLNALWPELEIVGVAANGIEARELIERERPDLAFLDIRMPGMSGLDVVTALPRSVSAKCRFVFVTAYDEFAVQAFECEATDYLLKPITDERLGATIERLLRTPAPESDDLLARLEALLPKTLKQPESLRWLRASVGNEVRLVAVEEVCYIQATDKYTSILTRDSDLLIRTPLKELLAQLDPELFWQIHRSTVVNVRQIVSAKHDALGRVALKLRDRPEALAVSRSYAHLFKQM
jgi:DNA-binding LytR/AlgR family response regulator